MKNIIGKITQSSDPTVSDPQTPPNKLCMKNLNDLVVDIDVVYVGGVDVDDADCEIRLLTSTCPAKITL